jgi:hypothetical protein
MKFGAENKKAVYWLAVLGVLGAISLYVNFFSDSSPSTSAPKSAAVTERERIAAEASGAAPASVPAAPVASQQGTPARQMGSANRSRGDEFHPSLHSKRKEDQIDPLTVDPTLHLELLAKVQEVKLDGGQRNLFQFGKAAAATLEGPEPIVVHKAEAMGPPPAPPPPPPPGPPPPLPLTPMTMKYYGLATKRIDGKRTAFFLDGEDIILATEGMTVKTRFRVVRINAETVVVEDIPAKREQTMKIAEDAGGTL